MKVYLPTIKEGVGGGWTFLRNFRRGIADQVTIVDNVADCDLLFISGVTMVEREDVEKAAELGKQIVFRMDNVPRKSRNKRNRVYDNIKRYSDLASVVVYQSEWAKDYCFPMSGDGMVILNGVDKKIFYPGTKPDHPIYLFAYHGKNEVKGFGIAQYLFQRYHRDNLQSEFWFIYNFKSELGEQREANFDFWNGEKYKELDPVVTQEDMAELLRKCTHLIYPAYADAAPNMVLEARASGLQVVGTLDPSWSGVNELLDPDLDISIERMCEEYITLFKFLVGGKA